MLQCTKDNQQQSTRKNVVLFLFLSRIKIKNSIKINHFVRAKHQPAGFSVASMPDVFSRKVIRQCRHAGKQNREPGSLKAAQRMQVKSTTYS
jgi:hypothetical protein